MKLFFLAMACATALLVACACGMGGSYECRDGLCIDISVEGAAKSPEPATYTIIVTSRKDLPRLYVSAYAPPPSAASISAAATAPPGADVAYRDEHHLSWFLDIAAGEKYVFTGQVIFDVPENSVNTVSLSIQAHAVCHDGARIQDVAYVYFDAQDNRIDEEQALREGSGTIILATPYPSITPIIPTPYPTVNRPTAAPEPTPTVDPYPAPENGRGAEPTPQPYPAP